MEGDKGFSKRDVHPRLNYAFPSTGTGMFYAHRRKYLISAWRSRSINRARTLGRRDEEKAASRTSKVVSQGLRNMHDSTLSDVSISISQDCFFIFIFYFFYFFRNLAR